MTKDIQRRFYELSELIVLLREVKQTPPTREYLAYVLKERDKLESQLAHLTEQES